MRASAALMFAGVLAVAISFAAAAGDGTPVVDASAAVHHAKVVSCSG